MALHLLADREGAPGRWLAVRLTDGGGDNVLYATRDEAIAHQLHSGYHAYLRLAPTAMSPRSALTYIRMARHMHSNGQRLDVANCIPIMPQRHDLARNVFYWGHR